MPSADDTKRQITQTDGKVTRYTYVDDNEFPTTPVCTTAPGGGNNRGQTTFIFC